MHAWGGGEPYLWEKETLGLATGARVYVRCISFCKRGVCTHLPLGEHVYLGLCAHASLCLCVCCVPVVLNHLYMPF